MAQYKEPAVLATYSVDELAEEAAICSGYVTVTKPEPSDRVLKNEIAEIDGALDGIKSIRTD
jgi:hypothetical protein